MKLPRSVAKKTIASAISSAVAGRRAGACAASCSRPSPIPTVPSVRVGPGVTALTRTPFGPLSRAWTKFRGLVDQILQGTLVEPRFFDFQLRKDLYDRSPVCKLCNNQIHSFDDCTVDHVVPYSKGGKTVPENAQLAHRGCNARKNAQSPDAMGASA